MTSRVAVRNRVNQRIDFGELLREAGSRQESAELPRRLMLAGITIWFSITFGFFGDIGSRLIGDQS
jgi:hypothetical protein